MHNQCRNAALVKSDDLAPRLRFDSLLRFDQRRFPVANRDLAFPRKIDRFSQDTGCFLRLGAYTFAYAKGWSYLTHRQKCRSRARGPPIDSRVIPLLVVCCCHSSATGLEPLSQLQIEEIGTGMRSVLRIDIAGHERL